MILLVGWADKSPRKYIKILAKDNKTIINLLKVISWHAHCELFVKIKRNNTIKIALLKSNFIFAGGRGKEVLLSRKPNKYFNIEKQLKKE